MPLWNLWIQIILQFISQKKTMLKYTGKKNNSTVEFVYLSVPTIQVSKYKLTHIREKSFHWGSNFSQNAVVKWHMLNHTSEKPYQMSSIKNTWTHTWEKPFPSAICGIKCSQNSYIKIHVNTHWGETIPLWNLGILVFPKFNCSQNWWSYTFQNSNDQYMVRFSYSLKLGIRCSETLIHTQHDFVCKNFNASSYSTPFVCSPNVKCKNNLNTLIDCKVYLQQPERYLNTGKKQWKTL